MVPPLYNRWATINGFANRTPAAIDRFVSKRLGESFRPYGDWLSTGQAAATLEVHVERVARWIYKGWLPAHRFPQKGQERRRRHWYFRRESVVRLARERPELFRGIPVDRLALLLEDADLARAIARDWSTDPIQARRIVNLDTGQVYANASHAARAHYVTNKAILQALRRGTRSAGYRWARYDDILRGTIQ